MTTYVLYKLSVINRPPWILNEERRSTYMKMFGTRVAIVRNKQWRRKREITDKKHPLCINGSDQKKFRSMCIYIYLKLQHQLRLRHIKGRAIDRSGAPAWCLSPLTRVCVCVSVVNILLIWHRHDQSSFYMLILLGRHDACTTTRER
jgi:hypothetical protein